MHIGIHGFLFCVRRFMAIELIPFAFFRLFFAGFLSRWFRWPMFVYPMLRFLQHTKMLCINDEFTPIRLALHKTFNGSLAKDSFYG